MRKGVVCQEERIITAASYHFESKQDHYDGRLSGPIWQPEIE
jgi:hypothetical protein